MRAAVLALLTACGRVDFDGDPEDLALEVRVVTGASSIDVEECTTHFGHVAHAVSTIEWPADWDRAYFEAQLAAAPPELVGVAETDHPRGTCSTTTHHFDAQLSLYVYSIAYTEDELAAATTTTTLAPMLEPNMFAAGANTQRYYVHHPEGWYRDPSAPMPMLIFLAGAGEEGDDAGTNFDVMANRGLLQTYTRFRSAVVDRPFLVVAPQCNSARGECFGWVGQMANIDDVVARVLASEPVDPARIYLTGLSTGGEGVYRYAVYAEQRAGAKIAAAVPASSTLSSQGWVDANLCAMAAIPVWAFHNSDDPTQSVTNSRTYVATLAACPATVSPQLDEGTGGHNAWVAAYADTHSFVNAGEHSIYDWMLRFTR